MSDLLRDLRFAARTLAKTPAWTLVTILVLAIGIGATTAMFAVVDGLLLRPFPFRDSRRIVMMQQTQPQSPEPVWLSAAEFHAYSEHTASFESIAAFTGGRMTLLGAGDAEQLVCMRVSSAYFRVLDGRAIVGRVFEPGDREVDALVVLSAALWQRRFAADPGVVGRTINLSGQPFHVIGVMDPRYADGTFADMWRIDDFPIKPGEQGLRVIGGIARLAPGVDVARATADLALVSERRAHDDPAANAGVAPRLAPYRDWYADALRPPAFALLGAGVLVLIIACANVAGLVLARAMSRTHEIAVRAALGATRGRIVRQLLTESALLTFGAGVLGFVIAALGIALILDGIAPNWAFDEAIAIDWHVAAFAIGSSAVAAIGCGLLPALRASRWDVHTLLKDGGERATSGPRAGFVRAALVSAEIAIAFTLLAGAGVLGRSFAHMMLEPRGFDARGVYLFEATLAKERYPDDERRLAFAEAVLAKLATEPAIESAAAMSAPPVLRGGVTGFIDIEGHAPWPHGSEPPVSFQVTTPGYATTLGVAMREGRFISDADRSASPRVAVVNAAFASRFFPGERAIGRRIRTDWGQHGNFEGPYSEIVGVYADTKNRGLDAEPLPEVLFAFAQNPDDTPTFAVRARSERDAGDLVRAAVRAVDPAQAVGGKRSMRGRDYTSYEHLVELSIGRPRFQAALLGAFAVVALLLTTLGVFALVSYTVEQRRRELSIRVAFGARPVDIVRLILKRSAILAATGLAAGLVLSWFGARLLRSMVVGTSPLDPAPLACSALLLALVTMAAGFFPARRAARASPMDALR